METLRAKLLGAEVICCISLLPLLEVFFLSDFVLLTWYKALDSVQSSSLDHTLVVDSEFSQHERERRQKR